MLPKNKISRMVACMHVHVYRQGNNVHTCIAEKKIAGFNFMNGQSLPFHRFNFHGCVHSHPLIIYFTINLISQV